MTVPPLRRRLAYAPTLREVLEAACFPLAAVLTLAGLALVNIAAGLLGGVPAQLLAVGLELLAAAAAMVTAPRRR